MRRQDFFQVLLIDIGLPGIFRVYDYHRALLTAVEAACGIDPDPSLAGQSKLLAATFQVATLCRCPMIFATFPAIGTTVGTKKYMMLVI